MRGKVRDEILRMAAADRTDIRVATEEYLARMAEDGTDRSLWDRIVTAFGISSESWASAWKSAQRELRGILAASRKKSHRNCGTGRNTDGKRDLELSCGYGRAVLRRQGRDGCDLPSGTDEKSGDQPRLSPEAGGLESRL